MKTILLLFALVALLVVVAVWTADGVAVRVRPLLERTLPVVGVAGQAAVCTGVRPKRSRGRRRPS